MNFKDFPKWTELLETTSISHNSASKFDQILPSILILAKVKEKYGALGLVLKASLQKLRFFDIDKWMGKMFKKPLFLDENEPYDFLQPTMV